jgi:hypothetical protein
MSEVNLVRVESSTSLVNKYLPIIKESLEGTPINVVSIHLIIKTVMELIEGTEYKGAQQKQIALSILRQLFIDFTEDDVESILLGMIDAGVISNLIDLVSDASKGKLNINKTIDTTATCCKFWIPRLTRRLK